MIAIILALVFIAIILLVVLAGQPGEFTISRQAKISAPSEKIFPQVNELRNWEAWNPWGKLDPNCKITYDGPLAGVDANYAWTGNAKVGEGRNTITESQLNERVRFRLEFFKPMKATNTAEFTFQQNHGLTLVTWTMSGKRNVCGKLFGLLFDCDRMIGDQFENGLAQLKALVETVGK